MEMKKKQMSTWLVLAGFVCREQRDIMVDGLKNRKSAGIDGVHAEMLKGCEVWALCCREYA